MSDSLELFQRERLNLIAERMKEVSDNIENRIQHLDLDIISTRNDPEIKDLWNKLCLLHMRGVVICEEEYKGDKPAVCKFIFEPQACITMLQLAEEETCCNRLLKRINS